MSYSQTIFGIDLYDLNYNDLEQYFNTEREETLNIEFKSYPNQGNHIDKENAVFKAVCGLLNSEGGLIVWGAPTESKNQDGNTTAQGGLTPFGTALDRDRLINKISSLITPLPTGIRVQQLIAANGNSIFIIDVEKSKHKPHQLKNNYYIRLDGQTQIAPHYLISAMMKSVDFPVVLGFLRLKRVERSGGSLVLTFKKLIYNSSKFTNDLNLSYRIVSIPGEIHIHDEIYQGDYENDSIRILSHGRPDLTNFEVIISNVELVAKNYTLDIFLNFVGEKSPSRISSYTYNFYNNGPFGNVEDESIFLTEKKENSLPSMANNQTDEALINSILDR